ncbi:methanethiol S-methyltransferase [Gramella sp. AN32]|uniref:methanethiol S-methyltransferase n=1 Tax=Christiangramia antarctica TaxID=2058158 RepID=A0ABW5X8H1_9FLAO|nr:methanethiol S-methyltransferase [Gramella sp. AN32]MCM4155333.1 hypothetical protein [Gramella sp. AN32]
MSKIIAFIFGILVYLLFLISFLYAIGFVGNILVPKSIDSGVENALAPSILINLALLSIFAVQHSVMARPVFKKWWIKIVGKTIERSIYVLSSSLALIFLYWQWRPLKTVVWEIENATISAIVIGLYFLGWLIVLLSTFMINHFELFGLKQIFDNLKNISAKSPAFQINFFYKIVRHPIMLGFLIAFWSTPVMTVGHLIFTVTTTFYIIVAVKYLEEKDLIKHIGEPYEIYQKKVPMFIPFSKSSN